MKIGVAIDRCQIRGGQNLKKWGAGSPTVATNTERVSAPPPPPPSRNGWFSDSASIFLLGSDIYIYIYISACLATRCRDVAKRDDVLYPSDGSRSSHSVLDFLRIGRVASSPSVRLLCRIFHHGKVSEHRVYILHAKYPTCISKY